MVKCSKAQIAAEDGVALEKFRLHSVSAFRWYCCARRMTQPAIAAAHGRLVEHGEPDAHDL